MERYTYNFMYEISDIICHFQKRNIVFKSFYSALKKFTVAKSAEFHFKKHAWVEESNKTAQIK